MLIVQRWSPWHIRRKPGTRRVYEVVAYTMDTTEVAAEFISFEKAQEFCNAANEMIINGGEE